MKRLLLLTLFLVSSKLIAAEFDAASTQFCEKVKSCVRADIASSGISPEMLDKAQPMIDGMCNQLKQSVMEQAETIPEDIEGDITACMNSMTALSCSALMAGKAETPACTKLQQKALQYQ